VSESKYSIKYVLSGQEFTAAAIGGGASSRIEDPLRMSFLQHFFIEAVEVSAGQLAIKIDAGRQHLLGL
jgi:hypothetical protein